MIELRAQTLPCFKTFFLSAVEKHLSTTDYLFSPDIGIQYLFKATDDPKFIGQELLIKCGDQFALCFRHQQAIFVYTEESVAFFEVFN